MLYDMLRLGTSIQVQEHRAAAADCGRYTPLLALGVLLSIECGAYQEADALHTAGTGPALGRDRAPYRCLARLEVHGSEPSNAITQQSYAYIQGKGT